jgi:hypothetical protein
MIDTNRLVMDSGASHHMFNKKSTFFAIRKLPKSTAVKLGDSTVVYADYGGEVNISELLKGPQLEVPFIITAL